MKNTKIKLMPSKLDFRLWMLDIRKKSKIYNLSSTIWRQRRSGFTLIELLVACHPKLSWDSKLQRSVQRRKAAFGFTLIELLVVISIMAILAGTVIYATGAATNKSRDARRKGDLQAVSSALVSYYTDNRAYPPSAPNTTLDFASDSDPINNYWIPDLAPYLKLEKVPVDPLKAGIFTRITNLASNTINLGKNYTAGIFTKTKTSPAPIQQATPQVAGSVAGITTAILRPNDTVAESPPTTYWSQFPTAGEPNTAYQKVNEDNPPPPTNDYTAIDSTYIESSGNNQKWFTKPALNIPSNAEISVVRVCVRAKIEVDGLSPRIAPTIWWSDSGPTVLPPDPEPGDSYYTLTNSYEPTCKRLRASPTGYSVSSIDSAKIGVFRGGAGATVRVSQLWLEVDYEGTNGSITMTPSSTCVNRTNPEYQFAATYTPQVGEALVEGHILINNNWDYNNPAAPVGRFEASFNPGSGAIGVRQDNGTWDYGSSSNNFATLDRAAIEGPQDPGGNVTVNWEITFKEAWLDGNTQVWIKSRYAIPHPENEGEWIELPSNSYVSMVSLQIPCPPPPVCPPGYAGNPCTEISPIPGRGACNTISNAYCYRVSTDKRVFVLWAQLENANDPQLSNVSGALCDPSSADFTTGAYANLGKPSGSNTLNYCIKSPPL